MDKLAKDGVIFDKHYCHCYLSGQSCQYRDWYRKWCFERCTCSKYMGTVLPAFNEKKWLSAAFAGKFGMGLKGRNKDEKLGEKDFDMYGGAKGQTSFKTAENPSMAKYADKYPHSTLSYAAFSKDVMEKAISEKKPFCLSISFKAPHIPLIPDPEFDHIYADKVFTKPANYGREFSKHLSEQSKQGQ